MSNKTNTYYVCKEVSDNLLTNSKRCLGRRVLRKIFPELHLFIHRDRHVPSVWTVSELSTGAAIAEQYNTCAECLRAARSKLKRKGMKAIWRAINNYPANVRTIKKFAVEADAIRVLARLLGG